MAPTIPAATEIWQEGLRIPPIMLYEAGRLREDLLDLLALNVRNPREFRGDLAAMIGAARRRAPAVAAIAEFGAPVVEAAWRQSSTQPRQQARAMVSTWQDGVFHGEAVLDDDGHGRRTSGSSRRSPRPAATSRSTCRNPIRNRRAS